jgi:hypothetical protein
MNVRDPLMVADRMNTTMMLCLAQGKAGAIGNSALSSTDQVPGSHVLTYIGNITASHSQSNPQLSIWSISNPACIGSFVVVPRRATSTLSANV